LAKKLQADYFLSKPVTRERLAHVLGQIEDRRTIERILVVDDNSQILTMIRRMLLSLRRPPYTIIEACGGQEGLDLLRETPPDVILLDLAMPDVSGYDFLDVLHEDPTLRRLPVILMTGVDVHDETPVYQISVYNQRGFSVVKSLNIIKSLGRELAGPRLQI